MNATATESMAIRKKLNHPVVDGDGHLHEFLPVLLQFLGEVGGAKLRDRYISMLPAGTRNYDGGPERIGGNKGWYGLTPQERHDRRVTRGAFWGIAQNTYDRATLALPKLLAERLHEMGIDFAVLYPTNGLEFARGWDDPEMRVMGCRAYNTMVAELFGPYADRMTCPAMIPAGTPQEALDELDYAIGKLGLKSIMFMSIVRRSINHVVREAPQAAPYATWLDVLAHASEYDYDPVWQRCVDLKVAVTTHSGSMAAGFRASPQNFIYNHIGHFAEAGEAFCKAVVLGGVAQRFPTLRFAFLEGGVGWACALYNNLIEHWQKRNLATMMEILDPKVLDREMLAGYYRKYGGPRFERELSGNGIMQAIIDTNTMGSENPDDLDEWKALKIEHGRDFKKIFENFYFGCEADDRMTAVAYNPKINRYGAKLHGFFSSDIGHFDVPEITEVLAEAYELVEDELLSEEDFRDFTFTNVVKLFGSQNPDFFKGTTVEREARAVLDAAIPAST